MNTQIYDIFPGQPMGRASLGNVTLSSDPHTRRYASGTSGTNTLTLNSAGYSNGDLIIIHQTKGTANGTSDNWEINLVVSGGGTTTLTLLNNLGRNYARAQVVDVKEYQDLTISSGWTITGWNGTTGALFCFAVRGVFSGAGLVNCNGNSGNPSTSDHNGVGFSGGAVINWHAYQPLGGFAGGWNTTDGNRAACGEGWGTAWDNGVDGNSITETANSGDCGGGGNSGDRGAGGGNATSGGSTSGATGGSEAGNSALTAMFPGGGGGGTGAPAQDGPGSGGNGGGMCIGWVRNWQHTGGFQMKGGTGGDSTNPPYGGSGVSDGGGGAGGSMLFNIIVGNIGTNLIRADKGTCPSSSTGDGSIGRVRINYGTPLTGSIDSSLASVSTVQQVNLLRGNKASQVLM